MDNRTSLKQDLTMAVQKLQSKHTHVKDAPITDLDVGQQQVQLLNSLARSLESHSPYPYPLSDQEAIKVLNGSWLLLYSDAQEIRSLSSLPLGLVVGKVFQVIDIPSQSFENKAYVHHRFGLMTGYVRITATFEPKAPESETLRNRGIQIQFLKRHLNIHNLLGVRTPGLEPFKVMSASSPEGRIPSLDITYLDQDLRLGRGGNGSLFILARQPFTK
ncbi:PAP/fibrillin family protein [Acaryochloris marina]|uniref:PAP/fibrillin family protein n=1 Tax=Acaryochloris marina TaxID=155978 RepID=UPI001BB052DD|nr:PAP/fibrillin family protein [Acaryochloris marina]QUY46186.1 fimbrial protein [Acaryochloris marina S15]